MTEFTKSERRVLRQIADEVYEAELHKTLVPLDAKFQHWRDGSLPSSELLREIHDVHQHDSRELWSAYRFLREASAVARGVALGLIAEGRVPADLIARLRPMIEAYRRWGSDTLAEDADAD